ncbi:MAG: hypothetical protein E6R08_06270 [Nevskiaceae bacterium]|nr:MAG: hypothetical protein E6R08_06270 [Nevskiaceae bacterium]
MAEAVRELIQNALDSDSPFVYEFDPEQPDCYTLRLNSEFAKLEPHTLLLGSTSKADNADAIGSFGEGFKIALLVLTRMGYDTEIHNGSLLWKPRFRHNRTFGTELLVVEETTLPNKRNRGLTFLVRGLSVSDVDAVRASCLRMQDDIGAIRQTQYGDILLDRKGELYVGGLRICETEYEFGYNIRPEFIRLERDRQTVASWDLGVLTRDMWYDTEDWDRVTELMESGSVDLRLSEYHSPEKVKDACYKHFRSKNPGAVVAKNQEELEELVRRGMTEVRVVSGPYYSAVSSSRGYREERPEIHLKLSPTAILENWLKNNRAEMRTKAIQSFKKDLLSVSAKWKT